MLRWHNQVAPLNLRESSLCFEDISHARVVLRDLSTSHVVTQGGELIVFESIDGDTLLHNYVHGDLIETVPKFLALLYAKLGFETPRGSAAAV